MDKILKSLLFKKIYSQIYWLAFILIFVCSVFIRVYSFPDIPKGMNQDEVSMSYESFSLATNHTDRWGNQFPIHFLSWGSGQNALLSYLNAPITAEFGMNPLSTRLLSLIIGILTIPLLYITVKKTLDERTALISAGLLGLTAWYFVLSRWALESNLLPFFILLGIFTFQKALDTKRFVWISISLIPFVLCFYAYTTSFFVIPPLLLALFVINRKNILKLKKYWTVGIVLFIILSLPILYFLVKNFIIKTTLPFEGSLPFTIPLLSETRLDQISGNYSFNEGVLNILRNIWHNFNDGTIQNSISTFPLIVPSAIILISFLTIIFSVVKLKLKEILTNPFTVWLFAGGILLVYLSFKTQPNVNQLNALFVPLIVTTSYGLKQLLSDTKLFIVVSVIFIILMVPTFTYYFGDWQNKVGEQFYYKLDQAIAKADELSSNEGVKDIYLSDEVNLNYMYILYYKQIPTQDFIKNSVVINRTEVQSYKNYFFKEAAIDGNIANIVFISLQKTPAICKNTTKISTIDQWQVGVCDIK